jgi:DNA-binding FrmR family transcriptional regulator
MMVSKPLSKEILLKRLKRIEGQVRGIEKMIEEGRDCESIITQLGAVRSATEGVGVLLLSNYTKLCFDKESPECTDIESLARAIAIWGRLRVGDKT